MDKCPQDIGWQLAGVKDGPKKLPLKFGQIGSVTTEICPIQTNVAMTNVAQTNVNMTVGLCSKQLRYC